MTQPLRPQAVIDADLCIDTLKFSIGLLLILYELIC